jgi:hypothetical protein
MDASGFLFFYRHFASEFVDIQNGAGDVILTVPMDPRLSDLPGILGLPHGDLDVIRTGGPAVTEDVLGELVVSTRVLGTREILLLNHTAAVSQHSQMRS